MTYLQHFTAEVKCSADPLGLFLDEILSTDGRQFPRAIDAILERIETRRRFNQANPGLRVREFKNRVARNLQAKRRQPSEPIYSKPRWVPPAFLERLPLMPDAADDYRRGVFRMPRDKAILYQHIRPNTEHVIGIKPFDVDRPDAWCAAEDADLPPPNFISINPGNGHGHVSYLLAAPVPEFDACNRVPIEWLAAIDRGYRRRLCADQAYNRNLIKNPANPRWHTICLTLKLYTLEELDEPLTAKDKRKELRVRLEVGDSRNVALFDALRKIGYKLAGDHRYQWEVVLDLLIECAIELNSEFAFPLSDSEVMGIVRSIMRFLKREFSRDSFSEWQRRSAGFRWEGHIAASKTEPWKGMGLKRRRFYQLKAAGKLPPEIEAIYGGDKRHWSRKRANETTARNSIMSQS